MYKIKNVKVFKNKYRYNNCILHTANTQAKWKLNYLTLVILALESKIMHAHNEHLKYLLLFLIGTTIRNIPKDIFYRQNAP